MGQRGPRRPRGCGKRRYREEGEKQRQEPSWVWVVGTTLASGHCSHAPTPTAGFPSPSCPVLASDHSGVLSPFPSSTVSSVFPVWDCAVPAKPNPLWTRLPQCHLVAPTPRSHGHASWPCSFHSPLVCSLFLSNPLLILAGHCSCSWHFSTWGPRPDLAAGDSGSTAQLF